MSLRLKYGEASRTQYRGEHSRQASCRCIFNRSDMAAEFYDRHLFGGKTYGDLLQQNRRPFLSLNATDMSLGASFQFTQEHFDYLCSDLSTFPVARAVAASAAFPILLSPVTVNNYAGSYEVIEPSWMAM